MRGMRKDLLFIIRPSGELSLSSRPPVFSLSLFALMLLTDGGIYHLYSRSLRLVARAAASG